MEHRYPVQQAAAHQGQNHGNQNRALLFGRGHHNGDEHSIEHNAQGRPDGLRQDGACQTAKNGSRRPAQEGQQSQPQQKRHRQRLLPGHGQGEYFIRIHKGNEKPGEEADFFPHALAQGQTHQGIAAVDNELGQDDLPQPGPCQDQGEPGELACTGNVGGGNQKGIQDPDALGGSQGTEAKAHGEIPHPHRHSPADAQGIFVPIHDFSLSFKD